MKVEDCLGDFLKVSDALNVDLLSNIKVELLYLFFDTTSRTRRTLHVGPPPVSLWECLNVVRARERITTDHLAKKSGVNHSTLNEFLLGIVSKSIDALGKMLHAYGIQFDRLFTRNMSSKEVMSDEIIDPLPPKRKPGRPRKSRDLALFPPPWDEKPGCGEPSRPVRDKFSKKHQIRLQAGSSRSISKLVFNQAMGLWIAIIDSEMLIAQKNANNEIEVSFLGCILTGFSSFDEVGDNLNRTVTHVYRYLSTLDDKDSTWAK